MKRQWNTPEIEISKLSYGVVLDTVLNSSMGDDPALGDPVNWDNPFQA